MVVEDSLPVGFVDGFSGHFEECWRLLGSGWCFKDEDDEDGVELKRMELEGEEEVGEGAGEVWGWS